MKPTSKLFTISEAAKELGYSSRSTLYRLIEKGCFSNYLWTDGKKKYLEFDISGQPEAFKSWVWQYQLSCSQIASF